MKALSAKHNDLTSQTTVLLHLDAADLTALRFAVALRRGRWAALGYQMDHIERLAAAVVDAIDDKQVTEK